MEYRTQKGDVLDQVCFNYYGDEHGTTEMVLQENPGLAEQGTHLPADLLITLPDIERNPVAVSESVQLWT